MAPNPTLTSRIAVIGAGEVGSTIAFSLILNTISGDILLVDPKEEARDAQVQDLSDATYHGNTATCVRAGTHKEAGQCDIVVITAGAKQKDGESRTDLVGRNQAILSSVIEDMKPFGEDTVLLLVANPVDILTYFAQEYSGLPRSQVFGSGTFLDSARLRGLLASKAEVAASSIDAYVLGEHGESQFVAWSAASIGGVLLDKFTESKNLDREGIATETKDTAASIMKSKGSTAFGIGGVAASICKSILYDERTIIPLSHYQEDLKCCLSKPAVLGRKGILRTVPFPLSDEEEGKMKEAAKSLTDIIEDAKKSSK